MKHALVRIFLTLAVVSFVSAAMALIIFFLAIMPERKPSAIKPADFGVEYEKISTITDDGLEIAGWFIPNKGSKAVIVIGHGYPFNKSAVLKQTLFLNKQFNLLYFDLRHFGESEGKYTTFGVKEKLDIKAVEEYLAKRKALDPGRAGYYGYSLSAAAFIQSNPQMAKAMVLDSPFLSMNEMMKDAYGWLIGPLKWPFLWLSSLYSKWILNISIKDASAIAVVSRLQMPVLFIHGREDKQIPFWHSEKLFEACRSENKELWLMDGVNHTDRTGVIKEAYEKRLTDFFVEWLVTKDKPADNVLQELGK